MNFRIINDESYAEFSGQLDPKTTGSTGADLYSMEKVIIHVGKVALIRTGVFLTKAHNVEIQVRGRSGMAANGILAHLGTIDMDYRQEIKVILFNSTEYPFIIERGDRVGQIVVFEDRGKWAYSSDEERIGGFGSTGR